MNTTLLLAALLLPCAVQAEIYVCDTEVNADLGSVNILYDEPELQDQYVIDIEKGTLTKTAMSSKRIVDPVGRKISCNIEHNLIICIEDDKLIGPNPLNRFILETRGEINFSYTSISLRGMANISSALGSCTKI